MSKIDFFYPNCNLANQTVAPTITGFQDLKRCIQYPDSHYHKPFIFCSNSYNESNVIRLT